jgi:hypothetical protein
MLIPRETDTAKEAKAGRGDTMESPFGFSKPDLFS